MTVIFKLFLMNSIVFKRNKKHALLEISKIESIEKKEVEQRKYKWSDTNYQLQYVLKIIDLLSIEVVFYINFFFINFTN